MNSFPASKPWLRLTSSLANVRPCVGPPRCSAGSLSEVYGYCRTSGDILNLLLPGYESFPQSMPKLPLSYLFYGVLVILYGKHWITFHYWKQKQFCDYVTMSKWEGITSQKIGKWLKPHPLDNALSLSRIKMGLKVPITSNDLPAINILLYAICIDVSKYWYVLTFQWDDLKSIAGKLLISQNCIFS